MSRTKFLGAFLATLALTTPASAYEVKHSTQGELVRWKTANVGWALDPSLNRLKGGTDAVAEAVDAWSARGGAPTLDVVDTVTAHTAGFDRVNTITHSRGAHALAGKALAITILSFDDRTGAVLDADVVINGKYRFGAPSIKDESTYDIGRVVSHEMGHALGLSDEPSHEEVIMFPYVAPARVLSTAPTADDIAGLEKLYAGGAALADASSDSAGCGGATVARRNHTTLPTTAFAAVALVGAALVFARGNQRSRRVAAGGAVAAALVVGAPPSLSPTKATPRVALHDDAFATSATSATPAAADVAPGEASVVASRTTNVDGIFRTELTLAMASCGGVATCSPRVEAVAWGGTMGGVRQEVGGVAAPQTGDRVKVAFDAPSALGSLTRVVPTAPASIVRAVAKLTDAEDARGARGGR